MRYSMLVENIELSDAIISFAKDITLDVYNNIREQLKKYGALENKIIEPLTKFNTSSDIIKNAISGGSCIKAGNMPKLKHIAGRYYKGDIYINLSYSLLYAEIGRLESVIVHELRHLIDDYLSSNKAFNNYKSSDPVSKNNIHYLRNKSEISARMEQAMHDLDRYQDYFITDTGINKTLLLSSIREISYNFKLSLGPIFEPEYKKFLKRCVTYAFHLYQNKVNQGIK